MKSSGTAQKILLATTAFGTLLVLAAVAYFAQNGSGFGVDILRSAAGSVLGTTTVLVLTRSPRRGRRIAALLLLASVVGFLVLLLVVIASAAAGQGQEDGPGFIAGFLGCTMGMSLVRLLGINLLGSRGDQASRRRS